MSVHKYPLGFWVKFMVIDVKTRGLFWVPDWLGDIYFSSIKSSKKYIQLTFDF